MVIEPCFFFQPRHLCDVEVRNTIVNLFLQLQSVLLNVALMTQPTRPSFVKMHLHWDETGQSMRLRRGLIEVEGVMSVLASW